jgi:micrococcal nuclease
LNKTAYIQVYGLGPSNPVFSVIYLNGININLEMVRAGRAEAYRGKALEGFNSAPYLEAEAEARENKKGMWSLGGEYISPGKWRKMYRQS